MGGGIVKCKIILDRGGYVPGESILINATVNNSSNVTIKSTKAALTEVRSFAKCIHYIRSNLFIV